MQKFSILPLIITINFLLLLLLLITQNSQSLKLSVAEKLAKAQSLVDKINGENGGLWKAKVHNRFGKMEASELKRYCGAVLKKKSPGPKPKANGAKEEESKPATSINASCTDSFDLRTAFPACASIIGSIQDQSSCGSCWAVSGASAFTDRYCIARVKKGMSAPASNDPSSRFSARDMLSCATYTSGCSGGDPYNAWLWTYTTGIVTGTDYSWNSGCEPYPFPPHGTTNYATPPCLSSCTTSWNKAYSSDKKFSGWLGFFQGQGRQAEIQNEIRTNGSVIAVFYIYNDFFYYSSGIYVHSPSASYIGESHAVRVIGWGTDVVNGNSVDYWLAANQWNTDWGMNGYFKIKRGTDECGFESLEISFGVPKL